MWFLVLLSTPCGDSFYDWRYSLYLDNNDGLLLSEIDHIVALYDGNKSHGPDGFNFSFI